MYALCITWWAPCVKLNLTPVITFRSYVHTILVIVLLPVNLKSKRKCYVLCYMLIINWRSEQSSSGSLPSIGRFKCLTSPLLSLLGFCFQLFISINQSVNQSIKIYIAALKDPYSEALPIQAKRNRTVLRRWWNWEQAPFGRCLRSIGSPFQVVGPTTEKERFCIVAERANGSTKLPWTEDRSVRRPAQEGRGLQSSRR